MSPSQVPSERPSRSRAISTATFRTFLPLAVLSLGLWPAGCEGNSSYYTFNETTNVVNPDAGGGDPDPVDPPPTDPDAGEEPTPDAGPSVIAPGVPIPDTNPEQLALQVFDNPGAHYWFVVSEAQVEAMNQEFQGGGGDIYGDLYSPGGGAVGGENFVDHLVVTTPGDDPHTADFGKVQVKLVGESTGRPWTTETLPNLKIDADQFDQGKDIGGSKHFRFNNAVVGSIFREKLTLDLYRALGYPAPRASYAWVSSSVWGPDVKIPYIVVESYKPQFCKLREADLGGGCVNMWEFPGDIGAFRFEEPESCQFAECDSTNVTAFELEVMATPTGDGFKAALADSFDWESFHKFQCLSWILGTGDDILHNGGNNMLLAERADGKFQYFPYSVDISLGQDWYPTVSLGGGGYFATGCQSETSCWADTIAACETLVDAFIAADPVGRANAIKADLERLGMMRAGDERRHTELVSYLTRRIQELPVELEANRNGPIYNGCDYPLVRCGDYCDYPENCYLCQPEPLPDGGVVGAGGAGGIDVGGEAGAAGAANEGAEARLVVGGGDQAPIGDIALPPFPIPDPPIQEPPVCQPPVDGYPVPVEPPRFLF